MPCKAKSHLRVHSWANEVGITFPPKFLEHLRARLPEECIDLDFARDWTPWFSNFWYDKLHRRLTMDIVPVRLSKHDRDFRLGFQTASGWPKDRQQRILRLYRRPHGDKILPAALRYIPKFSIRDLDPSAISFEPGAGRYGHGRVTVNFSWDFTGPEDQQDRLPEECTRDCGPDKTVGLEDIRTASILSVGTVIGLRSQDGRRLTTRRLTEGDVRQLKQIFCRDD